MGHGQWATGNASTCVPQGANRQCPMPVLLLQVCEGAGVRLVVPPPRWCTDNGVMVAWAGYER
jgi:tRNA A37 threonylcarbamoyltransferase TsaD